LVDLDFQLKVAEALGRIEQKINDIASPNGLSGRVKALEDNKVRQFWVTVAIAPTLAVLHGVARKFGVDI
jgi:hypothetical protein